jgi:multiple sugar transport system substrate-binding protein
MKNKAVKTFDKANRQPGEPSGLQLHTNRTRSMEDIEKIIEQYKRESQFQLPTESELMETLGYGRHSIREAIKAFVARGVLEKVQGKGTFIVNGRDRINFSGWIGTEPPGDVILDNITSIFRKKSGQPEIQYTPIPYYQNIESLVKMAVEGRMPDVMQLGPHFGSILNDFSALLPLDKHMNHITMRRRYPVDVETGRMGKRLYAVTWALSPFILYYNKNVLKKCGLNPDKPPVTLDDLLSMSETINNSGNSNTWGMSLPLSVNDPILIWLYPYFLSFKGGFLDSLKNIIIDSNENLEAISWLKKLYSKGCVPGVKDVTEGRMLFASDQIAFWIDGPFLKGLFRQISSFREDFDSHYGVVPVPKGPSGRSESILFNHQLAVSKQCKNIESACKWIEFLTTDEEVAQYYFKAAGCLPSMLDILNKPFFSEDPFVSACLKQMETVSSMPQGHPLFIKSVSFISQMISRLIISEKDDIEEFRKVREIINMVAQSAYLGIYSH